MNEALRVGLSVEEFWRMTPREVQLTIKAESDRRRDRYDDLVAAAWQQALWTRVDHTKFPKLQDVLAPRGRRRAPRTLEQDVARWQRFFHTAVPRKKAN